MRITYYCGAYTVDKESGAKVSVPTSFREWRYDGDRLESFFDSTIADKGVIGGEIRACVESGVARIAVDYWCSQSTANDVVDLLRDYTAGQLMDGIGEGGFEIQTGAKSFLLVADDSASLHVEQIDDGRVVPLPSPIAIAARNGDISSLEFALSSAPNEVDALHQGHTALHLAILYDHPDAAALLLDAGADPNSPNLIGLTPLEMCAASNSLSDTSSSKVAQILLNRGAGAVDLLLKN